jgi:hypothetical protein
MQVHNDQDCVLVIGDVRIKSGETKPVPEGWAPRVQALVDIGALRGHGAAPKADDRPSRALSPREIWLALSQADRDAVMAEQNVMAMGRAVSVTSDVTPAEVAASVSDALKAEYAKAAGMAEPKPDPNVVPRGFNKLALEDAKAWVGKCSDVAVLIALGNKEKREDVALAIIERAEFLSGKTN